MSVFKDYVKEFGMAHVAKIVWFGMGLIIGLMLSH